MCQGFPANKDSQRTRESRIGRRGPLPADFGLPLPEKKPKVSPLRFAPGPNEHRRIRGDRSRTAGPFATLRFIDGMTRGEELNWKEILPPRSSLRTTRRRSWQVGKVRSGPEFGQAASGNLVGDRTESPSVG